MLEVFAAARVMGRVRGLAALEGGCSGACSLPHLAALAYKIPQAAENQEPRTLLWNLLFDES